MATCWGDPNLSNSYRTKETITWYLRSLKRGLILKIAIEALVTNFLLMNQKRICHLMIAKVRLTNLGEASQLPPEMLIRQRDITLRPMKLSPNSFWIVMKISQVRHSRNYFWSSFQSKACKRVANISKHSNFYRESLLRIHPLLLWCTCTESMLSKQWQMRCMNNFRCLWWQCMAINNKLNKSTSFPRNKRRVRTSESIKVT